MSPWIVNYLIRLCSVVIVLLFIAACPLEAATLIFNTSDSQFDPGVDNQGWWSATVTNLDDNANYFTGRVSEGGQLRSFFTFDLWSLSETVRSATLEVVRFGSDSPEGFEILGLFDVSTNVTTLNNNTGTSATIFADLGSGISYGTFAIPAYPFSFTETLTFLLNAEAIADINAVAGGFFSIGGALLSIAPREGVFEDVFGGSDGSGIQRLIVETAAVPEPATSLLAVGGLLVLMGRQIIRRKSRGAEVADKRGFSPAVRVRNVARAAPEPLARASAPRRPSLSIWVRQ